MARRDVIEVVCDRCQKKENQGASELPKSTGPEFEGSFLGEKVVYTDLCKRCRDAVRGYFWRVIRKVEDKEEDVPVETVEGDVGNPGHAEDEVKKKHSFLGR